MKSLVLLLFMIVFQPVEAQAKSSVEVEVENWLIETLGYQADKFLMEDEYQLTVKYSQYSRPLLKFREKIPGFNSLEIPEAMGVIQDPERRREFENLISRVVVTLTVHQDTIFEDYHAIKSFYRTRPLRILGLVLPIKIMRGKFKAIEETESPHNRNAFFHVGWSKFPWKLAFIFSFVFVILGNSKEWGIRIPKVFKKIKKTEKRVDQLHSIETPTFEFDDIEFDETESVITQEDSELSDLGPFIEGLPSLFPDFDRDTERYVWNQLVQRNQIAPLRELASEFYPAHLIKHFPRPLIQELFFEYENADRIAFLLSLGKGEREFYLNCLGPAGDSFREGTVREVLRAEGNQSYVDICQRQRERNQKNFVNYVRRKISTNLGIRNQAEDVFEIWLQDAFCASAKKKGPTSSRPFYPYEKGHSFERS